MYLRFELDPELIDKKEIPVLPEDQLWLGFFKACSSILVKSKYNRLVKLLSAEKEVAQTIQTVKEQKKKSLNMVILLSPKACNEEDERAVAKMDEEKDKIEALSKRLEQLSIRKQQLKEEIVNTNFALLEETVKIAYRDIRKQEKALEALAEDMDALKAKLNGMIDRKHSLEEEKSSLYRLIHAFIGRDEADKLDKDYLE